ncbi:hypothetical protein LXL04_029674 [Taraxacum kok-saghyz]
MSLNNQGSLLKHPPNSDSNQEFSPKLLPLCFTQRKTVERVSSMILLGEASSRLKTRSFLNFQSTQNTPQQMISNKDRFFGHLPHETAKSRMLSTLVRAGVSTPHHLQIPSQTTLAVSQLTRMGSTFSVSALHLPQIDEGTEIPLRMSASAVGSLPMTARQVKQITFVGISFLQGTSFEDITIS